MRLRNRTTGMKPLGNSDHGTTKMYETFMSGMSSAVPDWHADAACSMYSWYLFELVDYENSIAQGLTFAQLWSFNQRNHELGRSICDTCPVKKMCRNRATNEDLRWTMRGGEGPQSTIGQTGDRRVPRCKHRGRVAFSKTSNMASLPACDQCAKEADVIVLTRLAKMRMPT